MASSLIHYEPSNAGVSVLDDMSTLKENAHVSVTVAAATSNNGGVAVLESQIIALQRQLTTLIATFVIHFYYLWRIYSGKSGER